MAKTNNIAAFISSNNYVIMCFLRCVTIKIAFSSSLQEYSFDLRSYSDRLNC